MTSPYGPDPYDIPLTQVEVMHDKNASAWRAMIKAIANAEIEFMVADEEKRTLTITLNNGRVFTVSQVPYLKIKKVQSLAMAFEYMFSKLESFPMAMEVKEE